MDEYDTEQDQSSLFQALASFVFLLKSIAGLWLNEVRFDLPAAARDTQHINHISAAIEGENISFTGRIDPSLFIAGEYVSGFEGYIGVKRLVETYAWDQKRRAPDILKWQESPDRIAANDGLIRQFEYKKLTPMSYQLDELTVSGEDIHFGNLMTTIAPQQLQWTRSDTQVAIEGDYFYFSKSGGSLTNPQFGDQRIRYIGLSADNTFTYFGRFEDGRGRADNRHRNFGLLNKFLRNDGVFHHFVIGDRARAIQTLARDHEQTKTILRWGGTALVCASIYAMLYYALSMFLFIPIVGWVIGFGTFIAGIVIGVPLSLCVIALGYLAANPALLAGILVAIALGYRTLRTRDRATRRNAKAEVKQAFVHELQGHSLAELEFIAFAKANAENGTVAPASRVHLFELGESKGWSIQRIDQLIAEALAEPSSMSAIEQLKQLIKLALADGKLSTIEVKMIKSTAQRAGLSDKQIRDLIKGALAS
ncbi:MAG: hypothetical protein HWE20_05665 [Gammaproteobacteria bacterium]|nr:hypothetical protein [Gammaproteobacteria bacterium]